jgi:hypothetical protein
MSNVSITREAVRTTAELAPAFRAAYLGHARTTDSKAVMEYAVRGP